MLAHFSGFIIKCAKSQYKSPTILLAKDARESHRKVNYGNFFGSS